jgi:putative N6-adenine-specific DNA methylase
MDQLFAVAAPGLEVFVARELVAVGIAENGAGVEIGAGGVGFEGDAALLYRANLHLRTAGRVLVRLGSFRAAAFSELRKKASRLVWERFLAPGRPVAVRAACHGSRLYHSDAVAERLVGAIGDRLGAPVERAKPGDEEADAPPQLVLARIVGDECTVSADSSGALLHRRGYRLETAKAPLRETLAAGLLAASGWDARSPLVDPFCGSGTIAIEAALQAQRAAPGRARRFAFMDWPSFDPALWEAIRAEAPARETIPGPSIAGSDRDAGAIRAAEGNAARAAVAGAVRFERRAVSSLAPPEGVGFVVTNPPYGRRLGEGRELRDLYARFGDVLRARCRGWRVALLCSDLRLIAATRLGLETSLSFVNGGLRVHVARGVVEAA